MAGGITFGAAKAQLATVVENGIDPDDFRVRLRADEAQSEILNTLIPVNGMQTVDVIATGTTLLLPKEMDSAYEVQVQGGATVHNQTDIAQGWAMVNQFTYIDPSNQQDNPLVDQYLQPDPGDATILRRQYDYPGLQANSTVRVTGPKRWLPIDSDTTYLIVQNVPALKKIIQGIEADENNDHQGAQAFKQAGYEILNAEIKKHQLDPVNSLKRKAAYDTDLATLPADTFGWVRARLAFELPQGLMMGKSELTRLLEQAEMGLMDKIQAVGMVKEYTAQVTNQYSILCPKEVAAILATTLCGQPLNIKSMFFRYLKYGNRWWRGCSCCPELKDEGEIRDADGDLRRQYRFNGVSTTDTNTKSFKFIGVLRWIRKSPTDYMTIKNFEALRMKCMSILHSKDAQTVQLAPGEERMALDELDKEISSYLGGQMIISPTNLGLFSQRNNMFVRNGMR